MDYRTSRLALAFAGVAVCVGAFMLVRSEFTRTPPAVGGVGEEQTSAAYGVPTDRYAVDTDASRVTETGGGPPVTRIEELLRDPEPTALWGRLVQQMPVQIQQVIDPLHVLVGPNDQQLVLMRSNQPHEWMQRGQRVLVDGMVGHIGELPANLHLPTDINQQLREQHRVFINVTKLLPDNTGGQEPR
jgi:hypothetical protein